MYMDRLNIYDKRLLKLAAFLRTKVPKGLLKMGEWMDEDPKGHHHRHANLKCGTPACAAGWATAVFRELVYDWGTYEITYRDNDSTADAIAEFFQYSWGHDSYNIFGADQRTPQEEADLIEKYVNERRFERYGNGAILLRGYGR